MRLYLCLCLHKRSVRGVTEARNRGGEVVLSLCKLPYLKGHAPRGVGERDTQTDTQTGRQTGTDRQADRQTDRQAHRHTGTQTDRQTGTQTDRQTDRHTDRQTDTPTHTHTHTDTEGGSGLLESRQSLRSAV